MKSESIASLSKRQEATPWRLLEHTSTTLGMGTFFSIFVNVLLAIYLRNVGLFGHIDGSVQISGIKLFRYLFGPVFILDVISHVLYFDVTRAQRSKLLAFGTRIFTTNVIVFLLVEIVVAVSGIDLYWSGVGVLAYIVCSFADLVTYRKYRTRTRARSHIKPRKKLSVKVRYLLEGLLFIAYTLVVLPVYSDFNSSWRFLNLLNSLNVFTEWFTIDPTSNLPSAI